ncbi:hypothetical protein F4677DRAFT_402278 [Hypoxylon crocopeplum]|nr:hypothetical protein F4677DRAFT_402278 [Hypoxylon crocopeplum]
MHIPRLGLRCVDCQYLHYRKPKPTCKLDILSFTARGNAQLGGTCSSRYRAHLLAIQFVAAPSPWGFPAYQGNSVGRLSSATRGWRSVTCALAIASLFTFHRYLLVKIYRRSINSVMNTPLGLTSMLRISNVTASTIDPLAWPKTAWNFL